MSSNTNLLATASESYTCTAFATHLKIRSAYDGVESAAMAPNTLIEQSTQNS